MQEPDIADPGGATERQAVGMAGMDPVPGMPDCASDQKQECPPCNAVLGQTPIVDGKKLLLLGVLFSRVITYKKLSLQCLSIY